MSWLVALFTEIEDPTSLWTVELIYILIHFWKRFKYSETIKFLIHHTIQHCIMRSKYRKLFISESHKKISIIPAIIMLVILAAMTILYWQSELVNIFTPGAFNKHLINLLLITCIASQKQSGCTKFVPIIRRAYSYSPFYQLSSI